MTYKIYFFVIFSMFVMACEPDRDDEFQLGPGPGDPQMSIQFLQGDSNRVVIQDLRLTMTSNQEGLDMIRMIRQNNPQTRIVVLTAYGSAEIEDEARRCGADAFLRKPKPLSQVAQVVQGLIESPPRQAARPA